MTLGLEIPPDQQIGYLGPLINGLLGAIERTGDFKDTNYKFLADVCAERLSSIEEIQSLRARLEQVARRRMS
jgi:hypothetical protein